MKLRIEPHQDGYQVAIAFSTYEGAACVAQVIANQSQDPVVTIDYSACLEGSLSPSEAQGAESPREDVETPQNGSQSVREAFAAYVEQIATLRSLAGDRERNAYTVALGQLRGYGLIDRETYREAIDRPRVDR